MLLDELTHRVKNTLAVVQSIAHQTQRFSSSNEDFVERFDGRLSALARAHSILVQSEWKGADLATLARQQLEPLISDHLQRLHIAGVPVFLPASLATPFGLVFHELATNAVKYGALSTPSGTVDLSWTLRTGSGERLLTVVWRESGGPPRRRPETTGLGTALIEKGIPEATVSRDFGPEGMVCTLELSLPSA